MLKAGLMHTQELTALTIAGFDPSSGAGLTADLLAFAAHGVFGTAAMSALTVQSTIGVKRVEPVSAEILEMTLATLWSDLPSLGIKIGMLGGAAQVRCVARFLHSLSCRPVIVLDPVLRSSSGKALLDDKGTATLVHELLPLVDAVTPNTEELAVLAGAFCTTDEEIRSAAEALARSNPSLAIVATGGHRERPDDLLLIDGVWSLLHGERVETTSTHGTGCAFSSALLCARLAGKDWPAACGAAKAYVTEAMRTATPHGAGHGPMNLLWPLLRT
jgi:hydroxymethylpyrimidine/phosphomethylpyrimidine kinase